MRSVASRSRRVSGCRRGVSILEVMIAGTISVWVMALLLSFTRFQTMVFQNGMTESDSSRQAALALGRMGPWIRQARSVVTAESTATKLVLQMPDYDGSGLLITPLADGDKVTFYLSDSTGSSVDSGDWLWMSVNDTPDAAWSKQGSNARNPLSSGGLAFTYAPAGDPEFVTVTVTASSTYGSDTDTTTATEEYIIKNHGL